eukprot:TRINITY_DN5305_c0_g1_i1.p1 TRINITY_DN5305_c0_g1~~TRINITY_DN5305_c0_g1_i1.p1  ORF type:complete len:131 (+),score=16.10 TRINITY_DN5305_c0_g1_i1:365-757(+)
MYRPSADYFPLENAENMKMSSWLSRYALAAECAQTLDTQAPLTPNLIEQSLAEEGQGRSHMMEFELIKSDCGDGGEVVLKDDTTAFNCERINDNNICFKVSGPEALEFCPSGCVRSAARHTLRFTEWCCR